jgi:hypothetical protein
MIRGILGVTFVTAVVSIVAAVAVIAMVLLVGATNDLTRTLTSADSSYLADLTDSCDAFQIATCEFALN